MERDAGRQTGREIERQADRQTDKTPLDKKAGRHDVSAFTHTHTVCEPVWDEPLFSVPPPVVSHSPPEVGRCVPDRHP